MKSTSLHRLLCLLLLSFSYPCFTQGQQVFQKEYSPGYAAPVVIEPFGNGYFVAGTTNTQTAGGLDGFLMNIGNDGTPTWSKTLGGINDDRIVSMQRTHDDKMILVGTTKSFVNTAADSGNIYLMLLDSTGTVLKTKSIGTPHKEIGYSVKETHDNGFIIAGSTDSAGAVGAYLVKTDNLLNVQWSRVFRHSIYDVAIATAVVPLHEGGYAMAGYSTSTLLTPEHRLFYITTDANGMLYRSRQFAHGNTANFTDRGVLGHDIQQNGAGNLVIVGGAGGYYSMAQQDIYSPLLMEIDTHGIVVHSKAFFLNSGDCRFHSVRQTPDGGYILGGYMGNYYLSMIKTDAAMITQWCYHYDANFSPHGLGYCARNTPDGGFILSGALLSGTATRLVKTTSTGQSGCDQAVPIGGGGVSSDILFDQANLTWTSFPHADTAPAFTLVNGFTASTTVICASVDVETGVAVSSLEVYPNPCSDRVYVVSTGLERLTVSNLLGETVMEISLAMDGKVELDASRWASGVYFLRGGGGVRKFVKE